MKSFLLSAILFFVIPAIAFGEAPFLVTESAIPIDKESYQADAGLQFSKANTQITSLSASLRYGLINNLEIAATLPYLFANSRSQSDNQFGDIFLAAKVRFIKGREANPLSIGGAMQVKVPFGSRDSLVGTTGEADVGFSALATKGIPPYEAHLNLGYTFIGNSPGGIPDQIHYSLAVNKSNFLPNISLMGELFGTADASGPSHDQWSAALGASTFVRPNVRIDGAIGVGLSSQPPDYILNARGSYFLK